MFDKVNWKNVVKKSEHYLAIGQKEVHIFGADDYPWEFATECEPGCGFRFGIATGLSFAAKHPCGITFRWSFDVEKKNSNGASTFQIDITNCRIVAGKVSDQVRGQMEKYFIDTAAAVRKQGDEYQAAADKQYGMATQLERVGVLATV